MINTLEKFYYYLCKKINSRVRKVLVFPGQLQKIQLRIEDLYDVLLTDNSYEIMRNHPNPISRFGAKCFSQNDEDGITLEIIRRIGFSNKGVYAEYGVGDGTENNTLILAALGWKGFWVGGEDLAFTIPNESNGKFFYQKKWVTKDNIFPVMERCLNKISEKNIDILSIDLDGNDLYFCKELLEKGCFPKVFVVEYNSKFPPPIKFTIEYNDKHIWNYDDYQGASLSSLNDLFVNNNYFLVACNSFNGGNAFFVRNEYKDKFEDVPTNIRDIYVPPRYYHPYKNGHAKSIKTIENIFKNLYDE